MSFAFLDDVYNDNENMKTEKNYGLIVNDILNVDDNPGLKKQKFTRFTPVNDNGSELNYSNLQDMSEYIENKYEKNIQKKNKKINKKVKKENFENEIKQCEDFIEHLASCSRCRQFLIKKLKLDKKPDDIKREQYLDLAIFSLSGVFLLFLLDMVLNLGKSLNKK
tara:strand:- start:803 stop:1297 length:495 start_codon:yes stop_codon:yes gene_type:complete